MPLLMGQSSPSGTVQCNKFPGFNVYFACFEVVLQGVFVLEDGLTLRAGSCAQLAVEKCLWYTRNLHLHNVSDSPNLSPDEHTLNALSLLMAFSDRDLVLPLDVADRS